MNIQRFESRYLRFQSSCLWHSSGRCILIDPGVLPEDASRIQSFLIAHHLQIEAILFTHTHGDHFACWKPFAAYPTWGSKQIVSKPEARKANDVKYVYSIWRKFKVQAPWEVTFPRIDHSLKDEMLLSLSFNKVIFYDTPGHSTDHGIFLFPEDHLLFSGDMLIQIPQPFILQGFKLYYQSLLKMENLINKFKITTVYPGHGPALTSPEIIHQQLNKEKQYMQAVVEYANELIRQNNSPEEIQKQLLNQFAINHSVLHSHRVNVNTLLRELEQEGSIRLPDH